MLKRLPLRLGLPLLARELTEQAARRRTYVIRVVYACLFFLAAYLFFHQILSDYYGTGALAVLGHGRRLFEALVGLQFLGIYLFMPAITCSVLTLEKERNSLELLMLTKLGPWTILVEKLLSRLVPMFSFLLLSLPLLAFAYSLGGISQEYLWTGVWTLAITAVQVGALALLCSAFFRTTVAAFIASYLLVVALCFGLPLLQAMGLVSFEWLATLIHELTFDPMNQSPPWQSSYAHRELGFMFFGFFLFSGSQALGFDVGIMSLPILFSTLCCLVLARVFVVRRAFLRPRSLLMGIFKTLDALFWRLNERLGRGIVLVSEHTRLPEDEPVAWRETTKKSLGTVRYLFRVFVALQVPTAVVCTLVVLAGAGASDGLEAVSLLLFLLWIVAVLIVSVSGASLIAGERSHQTLDVLLTTPLSGREIVLQKMRGVRRLILVLCVPFLTVFSLEAWWKGQFTYYRGYGLQEFSTAAYVTCSLLSLTVYLPMVAWLSLYIGLRVRSQTRAIIGSLALIVAWCMLPVLIMLAFDIVRIYPGQSGGAHYALLLGPATIIPVNEFNGYYEFGSVWAPVLVNFVVYGLVLLALRQTCLANADRYLGRSSV